jgi:hypothetical protein
VRANPRAAANRWRVERKVFAISKGGVQWFPRYAFDEAFDPHPALARIMAIFDGYSAYRLAAWFDSTNGHLEGRRPRELLHLIPDAVFAAAREHALGPVHGCAPPASPATNDRHARTDASDYPRTRTWAQWLYQQQPRAQGLAWLSARYPESMTIMLFGDRIPSGAVRPAAPGATQPLRDDGVQALIMWLLDRLGCGVAPDR